MIMNHYEIIIYWSDQDQAYLAEVPELSGCMAHGDSYEKALHNVQEAMTLWLDAAREQGESIPLPKGRRLFYA
jgi:predicted RNase H-like HicB family nuclease